jgi:hypothetical protein
MCLLISNYVKSYFITNLYCSVLLIAATHLSKQDAAQKQAWLLVATRASILLACLLHPTV